MITADSMEAPSPLRQFPKGTSFLENWCFLADGSGQYNIVLNSYDSGLAYDLAGWKQDDGSRVILWHLTSNANQDFNVIAETTAPTKSPNDALGPTISPTPTESKIATPTQVPTSFPTKSPTSAPSPVPSLCETFDPNLVYHIIARHSGKALATVSPAEDALVVQQTIQGMGDAWSFLPNPDGTVQIANAESNFVLTADSAELKSQTRQSIDGSSAYQNWCLLPDTFGYYNLVLQVNTSTFAVDIPGARQDDGVACILWNLLSNSNQDFSIVPASGLDGMGKWEPVVALPLVPVAAANLPDGRILTWSAWSRYSYGGSGMTMTAIFDPEDNSNTEALITATQHDMFCPGTAVLPDTRVIITGGSNAEATTIYDPRGGPVGNWTRGANMTVSRGYHSMTMLQDGSVFTVGGSWSGGKGNKYGEVWDYGMESWHMKVRIDAANLVTADAAGVYRADNHMWLFTAPNGMVFHAGPSRVMHWIDTSGSGQITPSLIRGLDDDSMNGNAVMYDIGKILKVGGARNYDDGPATNQSYVIDLNGPVGTETVTRTGDLNIPRTLCNTVVLPNGQVVVIGGMTQTRLFSDVSGESSYS